MAKKNETRVDRGEIIENDASGGNGAVPAKLSETQGVGIMGDAFAGLKLGGGLEVVGTEAVTRPVLRQVDDQPFAVHFTSTIFQGQELKGQSSDGKPRMAPAMLAYVVNLVTGEEQTLVVNAAMQSALERAYPERVAGDGVWGYLGLDFAMIGKLRPHDGGKKQLREYLIKRLHLKGGKVAPDDATIRTTRAHGKPAPEHDPETGEIVEERGYGP